MNLKKILVTDRYTSEALALLQRQLPCEIFKSKEHYPSEEELNGVDAILIRSRTRVDEKLLNSSAQLKLIVSATSGVDHIDEKLCLEKEIQVANTSEANTQSAAETALMLTLQCLKRQRSAQLALEKRQWKNSLLPGNELSGKDFGIIGLGRVGSQVAQLVQAFGAQVFAVDPYKDDDYFRQQNVERLGLSELLRQVQILSLHVPLTKETYHMLNGRNLTQLTSEAIVINTSRGSVLNEGDLIVALEQQLIAGAGLDVFEVEPLPHDSKLLKLPQAVLSPHLGAFTEEAFHRASNMAAQKVINFFTH